MGDMNSAKNRFVWVDIPVADLPRAAAFYRAVLGVGVEIVDAGGFMFAVLDHEDGNGGCLIPGHAETKRDGGPLVYLNVDGRIRDAVIQTTAAGGELLEPVQSLGPHGFRALIRDTEGNRLALHSNSDA